MAIEIRTLAVTYSDGYHIEPHTHAWGQLIYASEGVMRVRAGNNLWIVPPRKAVWAPPSSSHEIWARGAFAMRTVYLSPRLAALLPIECFAIEVNSLLREIVLHIVSIGMLDGTVPSERRLIAVLLDQLRVMEVLPLSIRMPAEKRARVVADRLQANPSDSADIESLARQAGASARTLQRLFLAETGLRLSEWRQRVRLLHAIALLNSRVSVTEAGLEAGYSSTSAFIAAFRKQFGQSPMRYCASSRSLLHVGGT